MNKTISFVSLFKNVDPVTKVSTWGASFHVGDVDVSAGHLPKFDVSLFEKRVSDKGVKYLASKRPLLIEHSDITAGKKAGRYFTNIASIGVPPPVDASELDALLDAEDGADPKPAEPANAQPAGETL